MDEFKKESTTSKHSVDFWDRPHVVMSAREVLQPSNR